MAGPRLLLEKMAASGLVTFNPVQFRYVKPERSYIKQMALLSASFNFLSFCDKCQIVDSREERS